MEIVKKLLRILLAFTGVLTSTYLTIHFYNINYPGDVSTGSFCDISSTWNCDIASLSPYSNFYGVPSSSFGLVIFLFFLLASLLKSEIFKEFVGKLTFINMIGCLAFFTYSVISLKSVCPGCFIYYCCSLGLLILFWSYVFKPIQIRKLTLPSSLFLAVMAINIVSFYAYSSHKNNEVGKLKSHILKLLDNSTNYEVFNFNSPLRLYSSTKKFEDAPLRITIFSDFQCPICKVYAEQILSAIEKKFHNKVNIQYFPYPLDSECNKNVSSAFHPLACAASYLAVCAKEANFRKIHDELYLNQNNFSEEYLNQISKKYNIYNCFYDSVTKTKIESMINEGDKVGLEGTPLTLINGIRIEGIISLKVLTLLCEETLKREEAKNKAE